jgi:hypothetical protein
MRAKRAVGGAALAAALAVALVVGVLAVLFLTREDPGSKPVDEAIEEFEAGTTVPAGGARRGPEPGIYQAEGDGREALSIPGVSQDDGAVLPVTVESLDDRCWRFTVDFNEAHWQDWRFCEEDGRLVDHGGQTFQRWDFGALTVENLTTFACDPPSVVFDPDAEAGASWPQSCSGTSTEVSGTTTSAGPAHDLGEEELVIGGQPVVARHHRQERTLSGAQAGTSVEDFWFAVDTGLPLRQERDIRLESDSPVGPVGYTESGWWQLTTLDPVQR